MIAAHCSGGSLWPCGTRRRIRYRRSQIERTAVQLPTLDIASTKRSTINSNPRPTPMMAAVL